MKNISKLITVFTLMGLCIAAFGADRSGSPSTKQSCSALAINQAKYDLAKQEGQSDEDAELSASIIVSFNQKKYDFAKSSGLSDQLALRSAAVFKYANNSDICQLYRSLMKD